MRVVDVDDLSRLHLALGEVTDDEADEVLRAAGLGRLRDEQTALLDAAALRVAAGDRASRPTGPSGSTPWSPPRAEKGWVADDGASLQVHVESAAGA